MFHDFMWGWGWFPWVIIGLVVWLIVESNKRKDNMVPRQETALDILNKRYARGEITKEQYDQMKRDIE